MAIPDATLVRDVSPVHAAGRAVTGLLAPLPRNAAVRPARGPPGGHAGGAGRIGTADCGPIRQRRCSTANTCA
jgi:hypothetical protein